MKFTLTLAFVGAFSLVLSSCGGSKEDQAAAELKKTREAAIARAAAEDDQALIDKLDAEVKAEEEAAKKAEKEAAAQAVVAPTRPGEFPITITPDSAIANSYAVPVHVFDVSEIAADSWAKGTSTYDWNHPDANVKVNFGTKSGSLKSTYITRGPFRPGMTHVVVVVKLASQTDTKVLPLVRKPNPAGGAPIISPINLRLTPAGIQVR